MISREAGQHIPRYFLWIDGLRGLAATVVVVFHYHHFYLADDTARPDLPPISSFPYGSVLVPIDRYGPYAVQLFWAISGFVFLHVYLENRASLRAFFVARFARLYPLHFATLLFVAAVQIVSLEYTGHWEIYGHNDLRHFLLQLAMASNWNSLSRGLSFDGPIWSVSLETVIYLVFFFSLALIRRLRIVAVIGLGLASWLAFQFWPGHVFFSRRVAECGGYFFFGSALYFVAILPQSRHALRLAIAVGGLAAAAVGIALGNDPLMVFGAIAVLIMLAASCDFAGLRGERYLTVLGQSSYSIYLVHVPIQMVVLLTADLAFGGSRAFAASPFTLPIFVAVSFTTAILVYRWYERPAGKWLRHALRS